MVFVLLSWIGIAIIILNLPATGKPGKEGVIVVAASSAEMVAGNLTPYGPGFERDLVDLFAEQAGYEVEWIMTENWFEAWDALEQGKVDLVMGLGFGPDHLPQDFSIEAGPIYAGHSPVIVHNSQRLGLNRPDDLCRHPVLMLQKPGLLMASVREFWDLDCLPRVSLQSSWTPRDMLDTLSENQTRFAMLDSGVFRMWQPFYPEIETDRASHGKIRYRWYWSKKNKKTAERLRKFWRQTLNSPELDDLKERYFGFFPGKTDYYELEHLLRTIRTKVPRYEEVILEAAEKNHVDPLFIVAVIYQESRFDPHAVSKTNVRGLMQITEVTAEHLGIERTDPVQSIKGGTRYLYMLWEDLDGMAKTPWDRWFMALAAYNQGPGHLEDAIWLAKQQGQDPTTWAGLKKAYPLLSYHAYYSKTKHGYARGFEAKTYVDKVRYYYYILHGLIRLSRPEAEQLAPFVAALPAVRIGF